jgi:demethylmenaquinone methyltransferase/2-methoxy-6-polyprenyl-1,4-benzoquinol methylase
MNPAPSTNSHHNRRQFFNERAGQWMDMWNERAGSAEAPELATRFDRLFSLVPIPKDACVLDVGCGSGILVRHILPRLSAAGTLIETDYAERMIAENRRLHNDARISFKTADVMELDLPAGSIDLAMCFCCFPHFERKAEAMKTLARLLKPRGRLAIAHFDSSGELNQRHRKHGPVMHDMLPAATDMRQFAEDANLEIDFHLDEPGFYLLLARPSRSPA